MISLRPAFPAFLVLLLCGAAELSAQTPASLSASADNTLYESSGGTLSNGQGTSLFAGKTRNGIIRRAVLRFDVASQIPAGAAVLSVKLELNATRTNVAAGAQTFSLHKLESAWGEGASVASGQGGGGGSSQPGDATWVHTFFDTARWNTPGGDFVATASGSQTVNAVGLYEWASTTEMVADVQDWLDDPGTNHGWILIGNEAASTTAKRFASRESSSGPVLSVTFSPPTSVAEHGGQLPGESRLAQNFPNPFNPETVISYTIDSQRPQAVSLQIFNLLGQSVATLLRATQPAGDYSVVWNGRNDAGAQAPSGVYVYRLRVGRSTAETRLMTLLR